MSDHTSFVVPIVDLAADPPAAILDALIESSCAFVVGHDVPADALADMIRVSAEFFALPRESKSATVWPGDGLWRGWQPVFDGLAEVTGERPPDPLERFEIQLSGYRASDAEAFATIKQSFALWPEEPADFADIWTRYYSALGALASTLLSRIATALSLPEADLATWTDEHYANLVAINYLADYTPEAADQKRLRAHTDRGGLTLLWADQSPGGLEVMLPASRRWVPVQIPEGAFLIQAGESNVEARAPSAE